MLLYIERKSKAGFPATLTIRVDGEDYNVDHSLSRVLTRTDNEFAQGIFSSGTVWFSRGNCKIGIQFEEIEWGVSTSLLCQEIQRRVQAVNEAFEKAFPEIHEACGVRI